MKQIIYFCGCAVELEMPWIMSSSLSSPRSCGPISVLVNTTAEARYSASPGQHFSSSRSLDSSSWRKQVCEVRPNRSSTLGRYPAAQQSNDGGERVSADADSKTTVTASRLDAVCSPSVTATKATDESLQGTRAPRPPARSSSECCRCHWLRAASTVSPSTHSAGRYRDPLRRAVLGDAAVADKNEGRSAYGDVGLRPPPPPPPLTSPELASSAASVTSSTGQDVCVYVGEVDSYGTVPVHDSCLPHAGSAHPRKPDLGICSVAVDGSARYCLEDIVEVDETSTVNQSSPAKPLTDHQSVSAADRRRHTTSCTVTTFV